MIVVPAPIRLRAPTTFADGAPATPPPCPECGAAALPDVPGFALRRPLSDEPIEVFHGGTRLRVGQTLANRCREPLPILQNVEC